MAEKLIKCAWCGAYFKEKEHRHGSRQIYCSRDCRNKANYSQKTANALKRKEEKAKITWSTKEPDWRKVPSKPWDNNDPDCRAVIEYLKTVKPIDWSEVNNNINEELRKQKNEKRKTKTLG